MSAPLSPLLSSGRRAPRRPWWRWLGALVVVVLIAVLLVAVVAGGLWGYSWVRLGPSSIDALDDDVVALGAQQPRAPADATTLLIVVTDPLGDPTIPGEPDLAAPVLLAQYGGPREVPAVVALPPTLPVVTDGEGLLTLTQVQAAGGTDGIVRAVVDYAAVAIDHVLVATTDLLPELTDDLGPIERCGVLGCREVTGEVVRTELAQGDADQRVTATMELLRELAFTLEAPAAALRRPLASLGAIGTVATELTTDASLRGTTLLDIADTLRTPVDVDVVTLDVETDPDTGELVALPERSELRFQQLRDGAALTPDEPPDDPTDGASGDPSGDPAPDDEAAVPDGVTVAVLNGAGVPGLAASIRDRLEAAEIPVVGTGNAATFDRATTVVSYTEGDEAVERVATQVARQLDDAALAPVVTTLSFEDQLVDVVVTVGADLGEEEGA